MTIESSTTRFARLIETVLEERSPAEGPGLALSLPGTPLDRTVSRAGATVTVEMSCSVEQIAASARQLMQLVPASVLPDPLDSTRRFARMLVLGVSPAADRDDRPGRGDDRDDRDDDRDADDRRTWTGSPRPWSGRAPPGRRGR
jgi:hypothetical protein